MSKIAKSSLVFLLAFIMTISTAASEYQVNSIPERFVVRMQEGKMVMDEKEKAWVGIDKKGKNYEGWLKIGEGDIRLFWNWREGEGTPVLICNKAILSDGKIYFVEDKLVYSKVIQGKTISLEEDGGITLRELEKVLGKGYKEFISKEVLHIEGIGYPAPRKLTDKTIYSLKTAQSKIDLIQDENYQLQATLTPKTSQGNVLIYSSDHPEIAFVDEDGIVYGIAPGTAAITISMKNKKSVACKVIINVKGSIPKKTQDLGCVFFDYYDNEVATKYQDSAIDAMRKDGAKWASYINTYSYYDDEPIKMGGVRDKSTPLMREIREEEFKRMVEKVHSQGMKFSAQSQFMYDEMLQDFLSPEGKSSPDVYWKECQAFWQKFGGFLSVKADEWNRNPSGSLINTYWDQWFAEYERILLEYASWCEKYNVDLLVLGEYQGNPSYKIGGQRWEKLIANIRKVYSGKLVAVVNVYGDTPEVKELSFANQLDYININFQENYSKKSNPTVSEFKQEQETKFDQIIEPLYRQYTKKIIITVSYKSAANWANQPWFEVTTAQLDIQRDFGLQARMYEGLFQALEDEPWIEAVWSNGYYWMQSYDYINGRLNAIDKGQSIRSKPAAQVCYKWANKLSK
ncbi:glycoside hydrolase family 113 [Sporanaerobium hydrogeniformans]|uniref:glycoside hydrolase family 113 n=1 Tax=Sporanaerobium hydrogeniformans TaxID=3072179 RepID=UPI0015D518B6|nr:Ig-like domain-containing protein [Sporanaerobium hydrogeniformans]